MKLTFEQDTLPALSSISQKFTAQHNFLAGLGKDRLIQDLIWKRRISFHPGDIYDSTGSAYCGPTWSWASVRGSVGYSDTPSRLKINFKRLNVIVYEAVCNTTTSDSFGKVSEGHLVLKGMTAIGRIELQRPAVLKSSDMIGGTTKTFS